MVAALFISALFFSADPTPPQFAFVHIKVKHFLNPCQELFYFSLPDIRRRKTLISPLYTYSMKVLLGEIPLIRP